MAVKLFPKFSLISHQIDADLPLQQQVANIENSLAQLTRTSRRLDSTLFREQVLLRLQRHLLELNNLTQGILSFESTETWRTVYEEVLSSCKLKRYLSVALVHTEEYWRDPPGDRSITFNGLLVDYGYYVHRVLIIDDFLWPQAARLPSKDLYDWILRQYHQGIQIGLVRLSQLLPQDDLAVDFGIYGDAAVGYQQTDELGQTVRYEMQFGTEPVQLAEDRWKRLSLYAQPLESI